MTGIQNNIIIDDEQIKYLSNIDGGNHHVWQVYFKSNSESNTCDFKLSCVDRDKLQNEIDNMKITMPECKQVGSIHYIDINKYKMEMYLEPVIEGFSMTREEVITLKGNSREKTIFDNIIKVKNT